MAEPREREIKLDLDPADVRALSRHKLLLGAASGRAKRLTSVYFDTPDQALRKAGLTLRIRSAGRSRLQTVKDGGSSAGLFDRSEWEETIRGDGPDEAALRKTPAWRALKRAGFAKLEPIFASVVERKIFKVSFGEAEIEVALDRGAVECGAESVEVSELELELKSGGVAELFGLAFRLEEAAGLRPGVASKSERGFALLDGRGHKPVKAGRVSLEDSETAADAFRVIARTCLRQLALNEPLVIRQRHAEGLHQLRVAIRRLRSAISLFGDIVTDAERDAMAAELKRISGPLGRGRNLDVFLARTMPTEREAHPNEPGLEDLVARMEAEREAAYDDLVDALGSREWRGFLLRLVAWIEIGAWARDADPDRVAGRDQPIARFATDTLASRWRKVKRKGRGLDHLDWEDRHKVRIAAKKLRYAAEFFGELYQTDKKARRRHKSFVASLEKLQSSLGDLNDIVTGHGVVADLAGQAGDNPPAAFAAGIVAADGDARTVKLLKAATRAHAALAKAEPFW